MLSERVKDWTKDWKQQGIEEGKQIGIQEGRQIGIQEGRQEGRLEGEAEFFLRLLERKFGPADEIIQTRIKSADSQTLLYWGERILTAQTIEEIFEE